jgi:hypothetical protein
MISPVPAPEFAWPRHDGSHGGWRDGVAASVAALLLLSMHGCDFTRLHDQETKSSAESQAMFGAQLATVLPEATALSQVGVCVRGCVCLGRRLIPSCLTARRPPLERLYKAAVNRVRPASLFVRVGPRCGVRKRARPTVAAG